MLLMRFFYTVITTLCIVVFTTAPAGNALSKSPELLAAEIKSTLASPETFLWGASTSAHQCGMQCEELAMTKGRPVCDWSRYAQQHNLSPRSDTKRYPADMGRYGKEYITQLKDLLNINTLRISVEWAYVQPDGPETYNQEALEHYADLFVHMLSLDITPIVCFHHYTAPCWFADCGGFEKIENINFFVSYCTAVYTAIMNAIAHNQAAVAHYQHLCTLKRSPLWATFNSPEGVAFKGYKTLEGPPAIAGKTGLTLVATVLKNMLESHVKVYFALKSTHILRDDFSTLCSPRIGFLKNITQLDVAHGNLINTLLWPATKVCCLIGQDLQSDCIYRFFTTGIFSVTLPGIIATHINKAAPTALDWIGVNYYSNQQLVGTERIIEPINSINSTDNSNYRIYPEGLYRALEEIHTHLITPLASNTGRHVIPVYVTENGIATDNDEKRAFFYEQYLSELAKAAKDGYPVAGYLVWSAFDNYEWPRATAQPTKKLNYGLCSVSTDGKILNLKKGAEYYGNLIKAFRAHA